MVYDNSSNLTILTQLNNDYLQLLVDEKWTTDEPTSYTFIICIIVAAALVLLTLIFAISIMVLKRKKLI